MGIECRYYLTVGVSLMSIWSIQLGFFLGKLGVDWVGLIMRIFGPGE